jgi:hypothetical protein
MDKYFISYEYKASPGNRGRAGAPNMEYKTMVAGIGTVEGHPAAPTSNWCRCDLLPSKCLFIIYIPAYFS